MAHVTVSFLLELRELSLHPNFHLSPTCFECTFRLGFRVKETRDRMVEQRKMVTGSPCSGNASFNHEFRLCCCSQSSRKRESLCWKQAHYKLNPASHQVSHRQGQPHCRIYLEQNLPRQELHPNNKLHPNLYAERLALVSEHLHDRDRNQ